MPTAQLPGTARQGRWSETALVDVAPTPTRAASFSTLSLWRRPDNPTGHDRFRQIFLDHWRRWHDLRLKDKVPPDQRAYVDKIIQRLLLCRNYDGGYALYVCPGYRYKLRVPCSCKTRFCPSCGKVRVDNWVNDVAGDLLDVPDIHVTFLDFPDHPTPNKHRRHPGFGCPPGRRLAQWDCRVRRKA
jgi:hypothetical protein